MESQGGEPYSRAPDGLRYEGRGGRMHGMMGDRKSFASELLAGAEGRGGVRIPAGGKV